MGNFFGLSTFFKGVRDTDAPAGSSSSGGGVTAVTADGGLSSSGGTTPNITFDVVAKNTVMANITGGNALPVPVGQAAFAQWLSLAILGGAINVGGLITAPQLSVQGLILADPQILDNASIDLQPQMCVIIGNTGINVLTEQPFSEAPVGQVLLLACEAGATSLAFAPVVGGPFTLVTGERALWYCLGSGNWLKFFQQ